MTIKQFNKSANRLINSPAFAGPALFVLAIIARLGAITPIWGGRYVTPDELAWVHRSVNMRQALLTADWGGTIQAGHPGVITTWLGTLGVQLTLAFNSSAYTDFAFIQKLAWTNPISGEAHQHLATFLTGGRVMVILATSAGIWLVYHLLSDTFRPTTALAGSALLALDPWSAGLSSLLHVDAILATSILITLLLILTDGGLYRRRLFLAGVFTSVAILNKVPGVILLGIVPLLIFAKTAVAVSRRDPTLNIFRQLGWWLLGLIIASVILLPALWADPSAVFDIILADGTRITGKRSPIFFMGSADFDLGLHFYPLAVLIRQSPLATLGILLSGWLYYQYKPGRQDRLFVGTFLLFCLLFWVGITVSSREFVRYALPISMVLTMLGGMTLAVFRPQFVWLFLILQLGWMGWFWQFPLSAANAWTGGPRASVNQMALGWGEGVSQAAAYAANQPNAAERRLFTTNVPAAAPFYPGEVFLIDDQTVNLIRPDDFIVIPLGVKQVDPGRWQSNPTAPLAEQFPADLVPIHTVQFNGLDRAWLYSNIPDQLLHSNQDSVADTAVRFGEHLFLNSTTLTIPENKFRLVIQTDWLATAGADYKLVLTMEDLDGNVWLKHEDSLVGNSGLPAKQWSAEKSERLFQKLTFPADMPPADYLLKAEVFDTNGARLGVFGEDGQFQGTSALMGQFQSPLPNKQSSVTVENGDKIDAPFAGYSTPPTTIGQGETVRFNVWWQPPSENHSGDVFLLQIGETIVPYSLGMQDWRAGDVYRTTPTWTVPVDMPVGTYPLALGRASDEQQVFQPIGQIAIEERDRTFTLPADIDPLLHQFGTIAVLQHIDVSIAEEVTLDLIWQANRPDGTNLIMFVHLKNADGDIVGQLDQPPLKPTGLWLTDEVITDRVTLPLPVNTVAQIAIGLYDPGTGQRLAVRAADGTPLPDEQYLLDLD